MKVPWLKPRSDAWRAPDERRHALRQELAKPLRDKLEEWLELERRRVAGGGPTAGAIDYTLGNRNALTRRLDDGAVPIDSSHLEQQIKPWAWDARQG